MLVDYHWHTSRCGHARGTMEEYLNNAEKKGIYEVGFADHIPMYWLPLGERDAGIAMSQSELSQYIEDVKRLQLNYPHMGIKIGLEVDYVPGHINTLKELLSSLPLDYVLGSVHYLDRWGFDNPDQISQYHKWDISSLYERYFELVMEAAKTGLFDIMAHTDLIKKFGFRPNGDVNHLYQRVARTFSECGVCIEVNTAGLRVPARECYPAPELLKLMCQYKVPVTLGSDAHNPGQVGQDFDVALRMIKAVGYTQIATFTNRKKTLVKI